MNSFRASPESSQNRGSSVYTDVNVREGSEMFKKLKYE